MKENVRKQGILLPVSSIPSAYGIGTFGRESYRFVDFLEKSGNRLWQILPLGPTGYGDSPYQSFSTFAGNPYYIDLEILIEEGLLTKEICDGYDFGDNEHYVDYEKIYLSRFKVLKIAFENFLSQLPLPEGLFAGHGEWLLQTERYCMRIVSGMFIECHPAALHQ